MWPLEYQGSTLTFEATCPVGQVDHNFTCPDQKATCPDHYIFILLSTMQNNEIIQNAQIIKT